VKEVEQSESEHSMLNEAMRLYDLRSVSLGRAAHIAGVSISEFIDALGRAGLSVFQYSAEDVLAEVADIEAGRLALPADAKVLPKRRGRR
jgi:predicted HTH domain antitoxin